MSHIQDFSPGQTVVVKEGYPGTVLSVSVGIDATEYYVLLDEGKGEGWWAENEMAPTSLSTTAAHTAEVNRRMAAEDYPEIGDLLAQRPDLQAVMDETEHLASLSKTSLFLPLNVAPGKSDNTGYADGYADGKGGTSQNPLRHDPAYMARYRLGWAEGIKERGDVDEPVLTEDLPEGEPNLPEMRFDPDMGDGWIRSARLAKDASFIDFLTGSPAPSDTWGGPDKSWSHDWCRFRRNSTCFLPRELDRQASNLAGYAVWVPEERGPCRRVSWEAQEACPVSQPGPNVPGGFTDATVSWDQGGQRGGVPTERIAAATPEVGDQDSWGFHYTAAWADVQRKGTEVYRSGGVSIQDIRGDQEANGWWEVEALVRGVNDHYTTELVLEGSKVSFFACTCPWGKYAHFRSPPYAHLEGRLCNHAVATLYSVQSGTMFGKELQTAYDKVSAFVPQKDREYDDLPVVRAMMMTGEAPQAIHTALKKAGVGDKTGKSKGKFKGKVNGQVYELDFEDGNVFLHGEPYTGPIFYPEYHPTRGLISHEASKEGDDMPVDPSHMAFTASARPTEFPQDTEDPKGKRDTTANSKTAADVFSRREQDEIIGEGEGARAKNLAALDLTGTHYAPLEDLQDDDNPYFNW